jgi:hypothetical protein
MGLEGTRWDDVEWIYLPVNGEKLVGCCDDSNEPQRSRK